MAISLNAVREGLIMGHQVRIALVFDEYERIYKHLNLSYPQGLEDCSHDSLTVEEYSSMITRTVNSSKGCLQTEHSKPAIAMNNMNKQDLIVQQYIEGSRTLDGLFDLFDADLSLLKVELFGKPLLCEAFAYVMEDSNATEVPEFAKILINLVQCKHAPLVTRCFELLVRHFTQRSVTIRYLHETQLITNPYVARALQQVEVASSELRRNVKWLASPLQNKRNESFLSIYDAIECLDELLEPKNDNESKEHVSQFQDLCNSLQVHKRILDILNLSPNSFVAFTRSVFYKEWCIVLSDECSEAYAAQDAQRMDKNQDGLVDLEEFLAAGGSKEEFEKYDMNGDGVLDVRELEGAALLCTAPEVLEEVVSRCMQTMGMHHRFGKTVEKQRLLDECRPNLPINFAKFFEIWQQTLPLPLAHLFHSCYKLLTHFCAQKQCNKDALAGHVNLFHAHSGDPFVDNAKFLSTLYKHNRQLSDDISETTVRHAVEMCQLQHSGCIGFADFLTAIAEPVDGVLNSRASLLIMRNMEMHYSDMRYPTTDQMVQGPLAPRIQLFAARFVQNVLLSLT